PSSQPRTPASPMSEVVRAALAPARSWISFCDTAARRPSPDWTTRLCGGSRSTTSDTWSSAAADAALRPSLQPAGPLAGQLAVLGNGHAALDGGDVSGRGLHQPGAAGRQVGHDLRGPEGKLVQIDDVDVGQVT